VFTQYTDTMDYVRERLIMAGITKIGCYSGRGGQIYNDTNKTWSEVSKAVIKDQFRGGELTVLIGTDSMSEGLNLQTSGRLINYDMPWNLMRVEQRIGRVDRIGASYKDITVTNYFYADTVEQRVYEGIAEDYGDFTDIVGDAAPVLANIEKAIEQLALGDATGAAPQPDKACRGRLWFRRRLTQGLAVRMADRHHPLRLCMLTMARNEFRQVRCAVFALWSEHVPRYAFEADPRTTNLTQNTGSAGPRHLATRRSSSRSTRSRRRLRASTTTSSSPPTSATRQKSSGTSNSRPSCAARPISTIWRGCSPPTR
jgi:superfamily II DNA/RNA helicase